MFNFNMFNGVNDILCECLCVSNRKTFVKLSNITFKELAHFLQLLLHAISDFSICCSNASMPI